MTRRVLIGHQWRPRSVYVERHATNPSFLVGFGHYRRTPACSAQTYIHIGLWVVGIWW